MSGLPSEDLRFAGYPVERFDAQRGLINPSQTAYRLEVGLEAPIWEILERCLSVIGGILGICCLLNLGWPCISSVFLGWLGGGLATSLVGLILRWAILAVFGRLDCPFCGNWLHQRVATQCAACLRNWQDPLAVRRLRPGQTLLPELRQAARSRNPLAVMLADPRSRQIPALVFGAWLIDQTAGRGLLQPMLIQAAGRLPHLKALWFDEAGQPPFRWPPLIDQPGPLLEAFPHLEHLRLTIPEGFRLQGLRHPRLKVLVVEGLNRSSDVLADLLAAELPALEHLELSQGSADCLRSLQPLLAGDVFSQLQSLALRGFPRINHLVSELAQGLLGRLRRLDLADNELGEDGAKALLASPYLSRLESLRIDSRGLHPQTVNQLRGVVWVVQSRG